MVQLLFGAPGVGQALVCPEPLCPNPTGRSWVGTKVSLNNFTQNPFCFPTLGCLQYLLTLEVSTEELDVALSDKVGISHKLDSMILGLLSNLNGSLIL